MLDPKKDFLIYSDYLKPPNGFEFSKAISSTYSLDLKAILFLPVALYFSQDIETKEKNNQGVIAVLDALTRISKQVSIYCQEGKILVPEKYDKLVCYWEDNIHQIRMPSATSSFHPKIWLIRFQNDKKTETIYRFICTSRNLTLNRDWDVAFIVDGKVAKKSKASNTKNKPLYDFLKYLDRHHPIDASLMDEILNVEWEGSDTFDFKPILNDGVHKNPLTSEKEHSKEILIMTPFLDKTSLELHKKSTDCLTILSRAEELNCIDATLFENQDVYSFNPEIIDGESTIDSEGVEDSFSQQLHAKYYIDVFNGFNHIYLGSANMTGPASRENIEFLIRQVNQDKNIVRTLLDEITKTPEKKGSALFDKHEFSELTAPESIDELHLRHIIYELCGISFKGYCEQIGNKQYHLSAEIQESSKISYIKGLDISIRSLPEISPTQPFDPEIIEYNLGQHHVSKLSPYLVLSFKYKEYQKEVLVKMDIELPEERTDNIFRDILDSQDKLLSHISFLLNGEELDSMSLENSETDRNNMVEFETKYGVPFIRGINLYEDLLMATSRNPNQFEYINNLLLKLTADNTKEEKQDSVVTDDFMEIWKVFYEFSKSKL